MQVVKGSNKPTPEELEKIRQESKENEQAFEAASKKFMETCDQVFSESLESLGVKDEVLKMKSDYEKTEFFKKNKIFIMQRKTEDQSVFINNLCQDDKIISRMVILDLSDFSVKVV